MVCQSGCLLETVYGTYCQKFSKLFAKLKAMGVAVCEAMTYTACITLHKIV